MKTFAQLLREMIFPPKRAENAPPVTHELRFNGTTVGRLDDDRTGETMSVCVFRGDAPWKAGDYIIFESSRGQKARYKLDRIHTPHDPGDQHFLYCTFAPRLSAPSP